MNYPEGVAEVGEKDRKLLTQMVSALQTVFDSDISRLLKEYPTRKPRCFYSGEIGGFWEEYFISRHGVCVKTNKKTLVCFDETPELAPSDLEALSKNLIANGHHDPQIASEKIRSGLRACVLRIIEETGILD